MFEYKTYDEILNSMLQNFGENVRTDEGSLAYNACCKIAEKIAEVYDDMDIILDNILPDTMDLAHLIRLGDIQNVQYQYATYAKIIITAINENISFSLDDDLTLSIGDFKCVSIDDTTYTFECLEEGILNYNKTDVQSELTSSYFQGYTNDTDYKWSFVKGSEDEDEEVYRNRILQSYTVFAQNGNKQFYRELFGSLPNVLQVKPFRTTSTDGTFDVYLIGKSGTFSDLELKTMLESVSDEIPLGQYPTLKNATEHIIDINFTPIFNTESPMDDYALKNEFNKKFSAYCEQWKENWGTKLSRSRVRVYDIEQMILEISGVDDVIDVTINGETKSEIIEFTEYPVLGTIEVSYVM